MRLGGCPYDLHVEMFTLFHDLHFEMSTLFRTIYIRFSRFTLVTLGNVHLAWYDLHTIVDLHTIHLVSYEAFVSYENVHPTEVVSYVSLQAGGVEGSWF